jgi:ATP-dependent exoDNAse (exonuclease V) beta subunit
MTKDLVNRLNRLYVGFTRSEAELYVIGVRDKSDGYPFDLLPVHDYPPSARPGRRPAERTEAAQTFSVRHTHAPTEYRISPGGLISPEERQRGEFIHRVLFFVGYAGDGYAEDLLKAIRKAKNETGAEYPEADIKETVIGVIEHPEMADCFRQKAGRVIRREQEFSDGDGRLFRMDRVVIDRDKITVIDYKTGWEKDAEESHETQMRTYMKILRAVYPGRDVEGIIAYVDRKEVRRMF